eukprot:TRINITY_DN12578_c0_g1_i1.p1 TRINITY_DN12578_c0_g1~~TRINITY_DN12578_c0_g1_i1.p1  ORF type:complete len:276 (-),score=72.35 TRINITY_DN12578_c0_g1_i1:139-966(-)
MHLLARPLSLPLAPPLPLSRSSGPSPSLSFSAPWGPHRLFSAVRLEQVEEMEAIPTRFDRLVLVGAPGSGKGTQASKLKKDYQYPHISTGDLLRKEISAGTDLGKRVEGVIEKGNLVDDETMFTLVKNELSSTSKWVLDGYPRTIDQAKKMDEFLKENQTPIESVLYIDVEEEKLIDRIANRRVHVPSGRVYHLSHNPPQVEGLDDVTGEPLIQREDDTEEKLKHRLATFNERTSPLLNYYQRTGVLTKIPSPSSPVGYVAIQKLLKPLPSTSKL